MENKKPTITIGIPAYNEERNIGNLIRSVLSQKIISGELTEILVVSDASTDHTVEIVKSFSDERVKVIQKEKREGAYKAQNKIIEMTDSDFLVMLNADVLPANNEYAEELVRPMLSNTKVGLACGEMIAAEPRTFFEKIIINSYAIKKSMFAEINNGNNLYNCVGVARIFSRQLYKKMVWPEGLPEDAYSYFACISNGFEFVYTPRAKLIFRTPSNLTDHIKQSTRFFGGQKKMSQLFGSRISNKEYKIPTARLIRSLVIFGLRHPILTSCYTLLMIYIKFFLPKNYQAKWQIAKSTKEAISLNRK